MGNTNHKNKPKEDDSVFSKNHSKDIKYRIRKTEEKEAEEEINEFVKRKDGPFDRVS